jgi:hypothetical protein
VHFVKPVRYIGAKRIPETVSTISIYAVISGTNTIVVCLVQRLLLAYNIDLQSKHIPTEEGSTMDYSHADVDGYIKLDRREMSRLENGESFVSVIRPAVGSPLATYGCPGDTLGVRGTTSLRSQFNVRVVSNFVTNGKWITVLRRLKVAT